MTKPIAGTFGVTDFIVSLVTSDLSQDQATYRLRNGTGSSIAWILGHLLHYRHVTMAALGSPTDSPFATAFGEAAASDGDDYPPLESLVDAWRQTAASLQEVLAGVSEATLLASADGAHGEKTVLDNITFFLWHEAYHMGVLGAIRTEAPVSRTRNMS